MIIQCVICGARLLEKTEGQLTCQNPKCSEHFKRHLVYDKGMENSFQVTIPHHHSEMTEPGEDRIERYQQHLKVIIDQGILDYSRLEPDNTEVIDDDPAIETDGFLTDAFIELCTLCKGSCCSGAADHAHLKAQTISNLIMQQQDGVLTRQQIFDLYLEKIPELSITNSCINHTNKGCALPSDLRSAVCNSYFCQELQSIDELDDFYRHGDSILAVQRNFTDAGWAEEHQGESIEKIIWLKPSEN